MKTRYIAVAAIGVLAMTLAVGSVAAQSPFDGTWKEDPELRQRKTTVIELKNGIFQDTGLNGAKLNIKADATDQALPPESAGYTIETVLFPINVAGYTIAVKVVDDKTVETTNKKDGKVVRLSRNTVSSDGKTYIMENLSYTDRKVIGKLTYNRAAAGSPGSHAISGT